MVISVSPVGFQMDNHSKKRLSQLSDVVSSIRQFLVDKHGAEILPIMPVIETSGSDSDGDNQPCKYD